MKTSTMSDTLYGVMTLLESDVPGLSINDFDGSQLDAAKFWIDAAASLDAQIIRWPGNWAGLQPDNAGSYDQYYIDFDIEILAYAREKGIKVIMEFGQTPPWARPDDADDDLFTPPENPADYARAASTLHKAYMAAGVDDVIAAWEIWNEPNVLPFWPTGELRNPLTDGLDQGIDESLNQSSALEYVALLNTAYTSLKNIDPGIPVLGGSLAGTDYPYLEWMLEAGALMDGLAVHPYARSFDGETTAPARPMDDPTLYDHVLEATGLPSDLNERFSFQWGLERIQQTLADFGRGDVPLWITEMGWSIEDLDDNDTSNDFLNVPDAASQADYLAEALDVLMAMDNIAAVTVFQLFDTDDGDFGLLDADGSLRPSGQVLMDVISSQTGSDAPDEPDGDPDPEPEPETDGPSEKIVGTADNDLLFGTDGDDVFETLEGRDTIIGSPGDDTISGVAGQTRVFYENDGRGLESFTFEQADDGSLLVTSAATGTDTLIGIDQVLFEGDAEIYSPTELLSPTPDVPDDTNDQPIRGTADRDFLVGTDVDDRIIAKGENDVIVASAGDDLIRGGSGLDMLRIRDGQSTLEDFVFEADEDGVISITSLAYGEDHLHDVEAIWLDATEELHLIEDLL